MKHYLIFSGHLIDRPDRVQKRFPQENEEIIRLKIKKCVSEIKNNTNAELYGIAGGACGGDILFHEICDELQIPTVIYLTLPPDEFKKESVSYAGKNWDTRFDDLLKRKQYKILLQTNDSQQNSIWEDTNVWMLNDALKKGGEHVTLIALWNNKEGDNKGGTKHMIDIAEKAGVKREIIDSN
ncbi:hypothetical protein CLU81_5003 [Flavobacterium sp. 9]|uniref:hypothetical protein n=1 Tax=Flavobacterium sp. 9 TaxID=2035198 RepID=UPI000C190AEE|nr:hypothetical protein [Flavobacterium sp. 9]PIF34364.1 hypothetical protein CLU81_5003 [Flavobacterium sp. 9]